MKPVDYVRIGGLITTIAMAKALAPTVAGEDAGRQAAPMLSQPAPVYVRTIHARISLTNGDMTMARDL